MAALAVLNGSQDFFHTFSMALYYKWDVKIDFAYVLQFLLLVSDSLGSLHGINCIKTRWDMLTSIGILS